MYVCIYIHQLLCCYGNNLHIFTIHLKAVKIETVISYRTYTVAIE